MTKDLKLRLVHTACLLLLTTPVLLFGAAMFTLNGKLALFYPEWLYPKWYYPAWFYPVLFMLAAVTVIIAWHRSKRPISRIYWALMLSQFVLILSTEVWLALKLAQYLLDK